MVSLISVNVNNEQIHDEIRTQIADLVKDADVDLVFWSRSELMRRTGMSWNFIQQQFFFDPRFPRRKVGTKWYFPAKETRAFLEKWILEQPKI
ncbi:hypothetical protein D3C76_222330 [compost metagenome]